MNVVIAKHENGQKYLFKLPGNKTLFAGQLVRVRTKLGESLATCLCDSFKLDKDSEAYKSILVSFSASESLEPVVGHYWYDDWGKNLTGNTAQNEA